MLADWLLLVIFALATHRCASLLAHDEGPGKLIEKTRNGLDRLGKWWSPLSFFEDLFSCVRCNSVWFGVGFGIWWAYLVEVAMPIGIAAGLAMSSFTIWLDSEIP